MVIEYLILCMFSEYRFDGKAISALDKSGGSLIPMSSPVISKLSTLPILRRSRRKKRASFYQFQCICLLVPKPVPDESSFYMDGHLAFWMLQFDMLTPLQLFQLNALTYVLQKELLSSVQSMADRQILCCKILLLLKGLF